MLRATHKETVTPSSTMKWYHFLFLALIIFIATPLYTLAGIKIIYWPEISLIVNTAIFLIALLSLSIVTVKVGMKKSNIIDIFYTWIGYNISFFIIGSIGLLEIHLYNSF